MNVPMYGLMFSCWETDTEKCLSIVSVLTYVYELKMSRIFINEQKKRERNQNMFNSVVITG